MNRALVRTAAVIIVLLIPAALAATEVVDRIIAVVGNEIILATELDFQLELLTLQSQQQSLSEQEAASLRTQLLDQMVADKLVLQEALGDTLIKVTDAEVEEALGQKIEELKGRFKNEEEFEAQMHLEGLNLRELKAKFRKETHDQLVKDAFVQKFLSKVSVSSAEVRDFYDKYRDSLPSQPAGLHIAHLLLTIEPSRTTLDSALAQAQKVKQLIDAGGDFAALAQMYSQDATASSGGDLGYFSRGTLVPEFEAAAFAMQAGQVSEPVKSRFGYHVINIEDKLPDRIRARHILIKAAPSQADQANTLHLADSLRQLALDGADFAELVKQYSTDDETKATGGDLGWFALDKMTPEFAAAVKNLKPGDLSQPTLSDYGYHVIKVLDRKEARSMTLQDDWDRVKDFARRAKTQEELNRWLNKVKARTYVDIRL